MLYIRIFARTDCLIAVHSSDFELGITVRMRQSHSSRSKSRVETRASEGQEVEEPLTLG